jgi:dTDP-glucose 4,6-dehydratase
VKPTAYKILVTGGAGFIGSNFIHYLLQHHSDWQIVNLDKLTYAGNLENLADLKDDPRYTFVHGDIADRNLVKSLFEEQRFDMVAHLAAESHVDRSILDASPFIETNIKGTQVLLEAVKEYGLKKFLHASTDEVYGSLNQMSRLLPKKAPCNPIAPIRRARLQPTF